ncbi:MAG TPA: DUF2341 domain-containing protein [Candidatus Moranbacteria bacterium]|nr:DUF2341 domain-containing protein [Candidatus Moranbacteria bacterium]
MPANVGYAQLLIVGEYLYLLGGFNGSASVNTIYRASIFDPTTWTNSGETLSSALRVSTALVVDGYVYLFGGYTTIQTNAIYRAPLTRNRPNVFMSSWRTDWQTIASDQSDLKIGGQSATNIQFVNSTTLTATTPANTAGAKDVVVTNYDGQNATLANAFTYVKPPSITSITPASALKTGGDTVTITGSDFWGTPSVEFGGTPATNVNLIDANTLTATVPAHGAGVVDVVVINPDGQRNKLANGFAFNEFAPAVSSVDPTSGPTPGGTNVTIRGNGFIGIEGSYQLPISVNNPNPSNLTDMPVLVVLDTAALIAAGKMRSDAGDLRFVDSSGGAPLAYWIESGINTSATRVWVKVPELRSGNKTIYAYYGNQAYTSQSDGNQVFLFFDDFTSASIDTTKWTTSISYVGSVSISNNQLQLWCQGNTNGQTDIGGVVMKTAINRDVIVDFDWQRNTSLGTSWGNYRYFTSQSTPTTTYLAHRTSGGNMTILGQDTGLNKESGHFTVKKTGTFWTDTFSSEGSAVVKTATSGAGDFQLRVDSRCGDNGGNFANFIDNVWVRPYAENDPTASLGTERSAVTFGGQSATNIQFVNSTTLTATTPANTAGAKDVVVTNYDGQNATLANAFTYVKPPSITSITPASALKTGGDTVTITGSDFWGTPSVEFGGTPATNVNLIDANTLTATVPAHGAGISSVSVINPNGQRDTLSNAFTYLEIPPSVSGISPTSGPTSGGTLVTITGANFISGNFGSGADGSVNISTAKNINTDVLASGRSCADAVSYSVTALGNDFATLSGSAEGCIAPGDEVLLVNLQGTSANYGNVGNYETLKVGSVLGSTINFAASKTKYYGDGPSDDLNIGIAATNQRVILQRVPNYGDVIIESGGSLTVDAWNGVKGGVFFVRVSGMLVNDGAITASGKGYRGGTTQQKGENISGLNIGGTGGGGNGVRNSGTAGCNVNTGGGGGGGGGYGTNGINGQTGQGGAGGAGGVSFGAQDLGKLYFGGAGGGGGYGACGGAGGTGGFSGGIIFITASAVNVSGSVSANGTTGTGGTGGGGGGGAGGSLLLRAGSLAGGTNKITATGAAGAPDGGWDGSSVAGDGGAGGVGRISLISNQLSGTTNPTYFLGANDLAPDVVTFDGLPASEVAVTSPTTITAKTPAHSAGSVDVQVTNPDGQSATLADAFTYLNPPSVLAVNPNVVSNGQGSAMLQISGNDFASGATVKFTRPGQTDIACSPSNFLSSALVECAGNFQGAEPGSWDVVVTNPDGQSGNATAKLEVVGVPSQIVFATSPQTIKPGASSTAIRVELRDSAGRLTVAGSALTLDLATTSSSGEFSLSPNPWNATDAITFAGTDSAKAVYYRDNSEGTYVISASENPSGALTGAQQQIDISADAPYTWPFDAAQDYEYDSSKVKVEGSYAQLADPSYGTENPPIKNTAPTSLAYSEITSFADAYGAGNEGMAKYQLSNDGGNNWYWWNGSVWTSAVQGINQSNDAATINTHAGFFHTQTGQAGIGNLSFRAYLAGNGAQKVQLDAVSVGYKIYPYRLAFISSPTSLSEGEIGEFVIQAQDQNGNAMALARDLQVSLVTSSPLSGAFALDLAEDELTKWDHGSLTIPAGQSTATFYYKDGQKGNRTIAATPTGTDPTMAATLNQQIKSKYRITVTGISDPIKKGIPSSVTLQATDYTGTPAIDYTGTVKFSSNDLGAMLPAEFIFTPEMKGAHTFVNGVTMMTEGEWCVEVADISDEDISGAQCQISVDPPILGTPDKLKIVTTAQFVPAGETSNAITVQLLDSSDTPAARISDTTVYIGHNSPTGKLSLGGSGGWMSGTITAIIPAGATAVNVFYTDVALGSFELFVRDDETEGQDFGFANDMQDISVVAGYPHAISLDTAFTGITAGVPSGPYFVSLRDIMGNTVSSYNDQTIYLKSLSGEISLTGTGGWSNSISTVITTGQFGVSFFYRNNSAGNDTVTISDAQIADGASGLVDAQAYPEVSAGSVREIVFLNESLSVTTGEISGPLTVELRDQFGNAVQVQGDTALWLYASEEGMVFSRNSSPFSSVNSAIVSAGSARTTFYLKQTIHTANVNVTVSENPVFPDGNDDVNDAAQSVAVSQGSVTQFAVTTPSPMAVFSNQESGAVTVESRNAYGIRTPVSSDATIYFHTDSAAFVKEFSLNPSPLWSPTVQAVLAAGQDTLIFHYKDSGVGSVNVYVGDDEFFGVDGGIANAHFVLAFSSTEPTKMAVTSGSNEAIVGQTAGPFTLQLQDNFGNASTASEEVTIDLASDGAGQFVDATGNVLDQLTIPSGSANAQFRYKAMSTGTHNLMFSADGFEGTTAQLSVSQGSPSEVAFVSAPSAARAGEVAGPFVLELRNEFGVALSAAQDTVLNLSSSDSLGAFGLLQTDAFDGSTDSAVILAGQSTASFYYRGTKALTASLAATANSLSAATAQITISANVPSAFNFTSPSRTVSVGTASQSLTIGLYDSYGNPSSFATQTQIELSTSSDAGEFSLTSSPWDATDSAQAIGGQENISFFYKDNAVGTYFIQAACALGVISQQISVVEGTVTNNPPTKLLFAQGSKDFYINQEQQFSVYLADNSGQIAPAQENLTATISTDSQGGEFYNQELGIWQQEIAWEVAQGASTVSFIYRDSLAGKPIITVNVPGLAGAWQQQNVENGAPAMVLLSGQQDFLTTDRVPLVISLATSEGLPAIAKESVTVGLSSTSQDGKFYASSAGPQVGSITIGQGFSTATVYYQQTIPASSQLSADESPSRGWAAGVFLVNVTAQATHLRFVGLAQNSVAAAESSPLTVQLQDVYGNAVQAATDKELYVSSSSVSGEFAQVDSQSWAQTLQINLAAGANSASFRYKDVTAGSHTLFVSDVSAPVESPDSGLVNASQNYRIDPSDAYLIAPISGQTQSLIAGQPSEVVTVELRDQYGNAKTVSAPTTLYIHSSSQAAQFSLSSNFSQGNQITSLTVPAGSATASFYVRDTVEEAVTVTVSSSSQLARGNSLLGILSALAAEGDELISATITLDISRGNPAMLIWESLPEVRAGEVSQALALRLGNEYGVEITAQSDVPIYVSTSSIKGQFAASAEGEWGAIFTGMISAGSSRTNLYYKDEFVGNALLIASDVSAPAENPDTSLFNAAGYVKVSYGEIAEISFVSAPQTIVANHESVEMEIETLNAFGVPTPVSVDTVIYLRSTSTRSSFSADGIGWGINGVLIAAGNSRATFFYKDPIPGNPTVIAADTLPVSSDNGWINAVQQQVISAQIPFELRITNIADPQYQGSPSSMVVMVLDEDGYVVENYAGTLDSVKAYDGNGDIEQAILPKTPYVFDPVKDRGMKTFINAVAFFSTGEKKVSVNALDGLSGEQQGITVVPAPLGLVEKVKFINPQSVSLASGQSSQAITVQLQDADGNIRNASNADGFDVRIVSDASDAEFSKDGNSWEKNELVLNIKEKTNFGTFFYRAEKSQSFKLEAMDWNGGNDDSGVENDELEGYVSALAADHLTLEGSPAQVAGSRQAITIQARDENGNLDESYEGAREVILSGATSALTGEVPACKDASGNDVPFGQNMEITFSAGEGTCSLVLYRAESAEIEAAEGILSSAGDPQSDLDVLVEPAEASSSESVLSAAPNPQKVLSPVTVSLQTFDAFRNATDKVAGVLEFSVAGVNGGFSGPLSALAGYGIFGGTYSPQNAGVDLINAFIKGNKVQKDSDGKSEGTYVQRIEDLSEEEAKECALVERKESGDDFVTFDICVENGESISSQKLAQSEGGNTGIAKVLVSAKEKERVEGEEIFELSNKTLADLSVPKKYLASSEYALYKVLKVRGGIDYGDVGKVKVEIRISRGWLEGVYSSGVSVLRIKDGTELQAELVDEGTKDVTYEFESDDLEGYLAIFARIGAVGEEKPEEPQEEPSAVVAKPSKEEDSGEENDSVAKEKGSVEEKEGQKFFLSERALKNAAGVSAAVAAAAAAPLLPNILGALRIFGSLPLRSRKRWGMVYDAASGKPIARALVSIIGEDGHVKEVKNADLGGVYFFQARKGMYTVEASKEGYEPLDNVGAASFATYYEGSFDRSDKIVLAEDGIVSVNIPMRKINGASGGSSLNKSVILHALFWGGAAFSLLAFALDQTLLNGAILGVFALNLLAMMFNPQALKGAKVQSASGTPLPFATIKVYEKETKALVARTSANEKGEFLLILDKGEYILEASSGTLSARREEKRRRRGDVRERIEVG